MYQKCPFCHEHPFVSRLPGLHNADYFIHLDMFDLFELGRKNQKPSARRFFERDKKEVAQKKSVGGSGSGSGCSCS